MKKALVFASVASMIDQFNMENIHILQNIGYKVDVACNFEFGSTTSQQRVNEFKKELENNGINTYHIPVPRKITAINQMIMSYTMVRNLVHKNKYEIIHCQSPVGGVIARLAAKKARKNGTKVIYTAHGFHFFKGAPLKNWMFFYPIEKFCAKYTDVLITINKEDYARAQKFKAKKVVYVPGVGIDTKKISSVIVNKSEKRKELGVPEDAFVLLSVGELSKRKNHEIIIRVLSTLKNNNLVYLICGQGDLEEYLRNLAKQLGVHVILLGFRRDISELSLIADLFVFPSLQEGLPVALMEAMASGLPVVCSKIRGNTDLIEDGQGGYLVKANDVDGFANAIQKVTDDDENRNKKGQKNLEIIKKFDMLKIKEKMKKIYLGMKS
jgi:glycosyltransferase involved in cell wall biosynthesis